MNETGKNQQQTEQWRCGFYAVNVRIQNARLHRDQSPQSGKLGCVRVQNDFTDLSYRHLPWASVLQMSAILVDTDSLL
jgi:hypothetical protein